MSEISEKLRKQSHLPLHQKKYIEINLPKEAERPYSKNCKMLRKETKNHKHK